MMKKLLIIALVSSLFSVEVFAYTQHNIQSANFIAAEGIINNNSASPADYNLDYNITRREMLKVMMNLSGKTVTDTCTGDFSDISTSDWGCKYAEAALAEGYIAANDTYRPDDNITQIEALKMIMQAIGMQRDENDDWRAGYVSKASNEGLIDDDYLEYDSNAIRGWIFSNAARSYDDFDFTQSDSEIDADIEDLFNSLFDL